MKTEKYVAVQVHAFGHGMKTLFEGVAEVFSSMGIAEPDELKEVAARWSGNKKDKSSGEQKTEVLRADQDTVEEETNENETTGSDTVDVAADDVPSSDEPVAETVVTEKSAEETAEPTAGASTVTQDDITRIIVRKIKQDRTVNTKIGELLKAYGVAKVSELPVSKYEAFLTDLSAI